MNEKSGFSGGQMMMAFLGGAVAGATVALLTAPRSGTQTRARLVARAQATGDSAARLPGSLQEAVGAAREAFSESLSKSSEELS